MQTFRFNHPATLKDPMNTTTETETTAIAVADERSRASELMMDARTMESLMRVADLMASGKSTVPAHLQKNPADCMAVIMQSLQWNMNPFAVAQKTHLVNGTLGYEAQLVNAVVQASGSIDGRFHYEYKGASPALECRVGATIKGEKDITWGLWLCENKVTTKNSPLWKTNPAQQMGYLQVKNWARLFCPGAILGVYSPDEFEDTPATRNMGAALEVKPPLSDAVIESATLAAQAGVASYAAFWKAASAETRKAIGKDNHQNLKDIATAADKARTVDTPTAPVHQPVHQPVQATTATAKTFDEVMTMLNAAKNIDALYVAGDWVGDVADPEERKILAGKFDELKAVLEAA